MIRNALIGSAVLLSLVTITGNVSAAELLPLAPSNGWIYRDAVTGDSFSVQVGAPVYLNQRLYHTLRGYGITTLLVHVNEYGNIVYWDEERAQDILLISFEYVPKAWWEAPMRECPQQGQTTRSRTVHTGSGGKWEALDIRYRSFECFDAGSESEQFAENIGMVRRVVNTIAGPRTYDLIYARVGTQVISAGNVGGFRVTALPSRSPGFWLVTLRIEVPAGTEVKLNFPSSQEYDARLRDSEGQILWTWSADKLFAQIQHELVIRGGFSATIEVPHPPSIPEGPHFFTIEAWLTNAEREPRFAAVTGVELGHSRPSSNYLERDRQ
jgi:hypothetical protein